MKFNSEEQRPLGIIALCVVVPAILLGALFSWFSTNSTVSFDHISQVATNEVYSPPEWYDDFQEALLPKRFHWEAPRFHYTVGITIQGEITREDHLSYIGAADSVAHFTIKDCQHPENILNHFKNFKDYAPALTTLNLVNCDLNEQFFLALKTRPGIWLTVIDCQVTASSTSFGDALNLVRGLVVRDMTIDQNLCKLLSKVNNVPSITFLNCVLHDDFLDGWAPSHSIVWLSLGQVIISDDTVEKLTSLFGPPSEITVDRKVPSHKPRNFDFDFWP